MTLRELVDWYLTHKTEEAGDCLLFTGHIGGAGYPKVTWNRKDYSLHRLVCEAFHEAASGGRSCPATHACGNKRCINPEHLRWGTPRSNHRDAIGHGRRGRCRLTDSQVLLARILHARGYSSRKLARAAHISDVNMLKCVKRLSYQWV